MGGGTKGAEGDPTSSPPSLDLQALCEYMKLPRTRAEVTVMAKVKAVTQEDENRRAPITICAAIDRSGSMKAHLPLLKDTLRFMVQQLRAEDKLSLISFDHEVRTELPLTSMDAAGKLHAERAIDAVKERGHTNLSGGLLAALQTLYRIPSADASLVESVLLFTDGKANAGIRDQASMIKATSSMLTQIGRQACVFTFGYGPEHDTVLLPSLANAGNGLFYYIDNSDTIPESFCDCLGGLLSVAAQNVRLTLTVGEGLQMSKPLTTYKMVEKEPGKVFEITIPDVYCEEEKCILAKVVVPGDPTLTEPRNLALFSCQVEYFDVLNCKPSKQTADCGIVRNHLCSEPLNSDNYDEIELHKIRCEVADVLTQADRLAQTGELVRAKEILSRVTVRVKHSVVIGRPLAVHLLETLKESMDGLQDTVTYKEHGKAVMQNFAGSHWQQRSSTQPTSEGYVYAKMGLRKPARKPPAASGSSETEVLSPYRNATKMRMISKHASSSGH